MTGTYTMQPGASFVARVEAMFGRPTRGWRRTTGGYTPAARWVATFADGTSAFLKAGTTDATSEWLRREHRFYSHVGGAYLARLLGWDDDGRRPILALEDLSRAAWPPPWNRERVDGVLHALAEVAATPLPDGTPTLRELGAMDGGWETVATDPAPFLSLRMCSAAWLANALPALLDAEANAPIDGTDLLHLDIRSDNVCFAGERTLIVDWNLACVANALLDVAFWLPSLEFEGGPAPEDVAPPADVFAALIAGFFASRAGLPDIPDAPFVRRVQREQLSTALPWVVRALGLPPLDGTVRG